MLSRKSCIRKVLVITLSNIGDVVLTWPVIDVLKTVYPDVSISIIVGEGAKGLFSGNPSIDHIIAYDKHASLKEKCNWIKEVRKEKFDLIVDLRNSVMPYLLRGRVKTPPIVFKRKEHMRDKHLRRLYSVMKFENDTLSKHGYVLTNKLKLRSKELLHGFHNYIIIAPGAKALEKRWPIDHFFEVAQWLLNKKESIVLLGDRKDVPLCNTLEMKLSSDKVLNLSGKTRLNEVPAILSGAKVVCVNDSGIMHMASYINKCVVALFGPTDSLLYGPWSDHSFLVHNGNSMEDIYPKHVLEVLESCL